MKKEMSRTQRRRQAKIRKMLLSLSLVLVLGMAAVGGTIAWLTDSTQTVTNTFTVGNIDIELTETTGERYKMIPGNVLDKNPTVTVKANSEASWVFVKIEEANALDTFITYEIAEGWDALQDVDGVYYREQDATTADVSYPVIAATIDGVKTPNKVIVNGDVTKGQMDNLTEATYPTLKFTAYAIQQANFATAADAWAELNAPAGN